MVFEFGDDGESTDDVSRRILVLSRVLWEGQGTIPDVNQWLKNFDGKSSHPVEVERRHALHLLSHFSYFGLPEVRELLTSMYRDLFRYELIQQIRQEQGGTSDADQLRAEFKRKSARTRFLGVGNPSESGAHLLYFFRQQSRLPARVFPYQQDILTVPAGNGGARIADPDVERIVFIDDVVGSGDQAVAYCESFVRQVQEAAVRDGRTVEIWYLAIFATPTGLDAIRALPFDYVNAVHELNASQYAFSDTSHAYARPPAGIEREIGREIADRYGAEVAPGNPLGYGQGGLMLGLHHNVPDHTLPIFWAHEEEEVIVRWEPIFRRYVKRLEDEGE